MTLDFTLDLIGLISKALGIVAAISWMVAVEPFAKQRTLRRLTAASKIIKTAAVSWAIALASDLFSIPFDEHVVREAEATVRNFTPGGSAQ